MKRLVVILACAAAGYVVGAVGGYFLIVNVSGNTHDRAVEAAMTAVFVAGPIAALVAGIVGAMWKRR